VGRKREGEGERERERGRQADWGLREGSLV